MAKALSERIEQLKEIRDSMLDILEGRASKDHNSYSIGDRSISKMTLEEIQIAYRKTDSEIDRLERRHRRKSGNGGGIRFKF